MTPRKFEQDGLPPASAPSRRSILLLAACFFVVAGIAVFATEGDYGVASDVGNYFYSSMRQLAWLGDFTRAVASGSPTEVLNREVVSEHWRWMPVRLPHPPLSREIGGVTWLLFRDLFDTITAYRIGVMVTYAVLTAACTAFTATAAASLLAGAGAGLSILTIPVLFAHGHLAHTDLFLATFWFGAAAFLFLWVETSRGSYLVLTGILLGAALATKFSGLLVVPVLGLWILLNRPRDTVWAVPVIGLFAALVFFATNPVLWVDPRLGMSDYLGAGLNRAEDMRNMIRTEYFGRIYVYRAPWHYPFVWTLIVLPPTILLAIIAGLFDGKRRKLVGFCLLNVSVLYAALMLPSAPTHDGVRLFLAAFPFYAVLAGLGVAVVAAWSARLSESREGVHKQLLPIFVLLAIFLPSTGAVIRTHPYQLSYANFLVGGTRGAAEKGLEVTNLKEVLNDEVISDLKSAIPNDAVIDAGFLLEQFCFLQTLGIAPMSWAIETEWAAMDPDDPERKLVCAGEPARVPMLVERELVDADYLVLIHRRALWRPIEWALTEQGDEPFYEVALDGAPLLTVYRLR
jgi:4-amino-4-deoxy-L-arabinose transferase-like glycosyltransferase